VIQKSCAAEVDTYAIDAVNNQPELERTTLETVVYVAPRRGQHTRHDARDFKIPTPQSGLSRSLSNSSK
jgi:hypothetical protein